MIGNRQLPLPLPHRPALDREDFLVAGCNADAVGWVDRWPAWPGPLLTVFGPAGCGKTHLAHVWRERSGAVLVEGADLAAADLPRLAAGGAIVLDGFVPAMAGPALLHLYNMMGEADGHILMTTREAPARWSTGLADLHSRLAAAPAVAVGRPDDATLAAVLVKLFGDRQLATDPGVPAFLIRHIERSFSAAGAVVERIDAQALAARRRITVRFVREVLDGSTNANGKDS